MYELYFGSSDFIEPKCPKCGIVLDYGINTEFKKELGTHVCLGCGQNL